MAKTNICMLNIRKIVRCDKANLDFRASNDEAAPVYVINGRENCQVVTLAIQLICSTRYDTYIKLAEIWSQVRNGSVEITFKINLIEQVDANDFDVMEHSSDSDVPTTSAQAKKRADARKQRSKVKRVVTFEVKACRKFEANPLMVEYSVNNGPVRNCTINVFNQRFFSCTDLIFPRLSGLVFGNINNGRWLEILSTNFVYDYREENSLIIKFCKLYSTRQTAAEDTVCEMTTSYLIGRYSLEKSRIKCLLQIFQHIRCIFEYLTFYEYTVWFLLPQSSLDDLRDIADITINNINFDLMQTKIQLKSQDEPSAMYPWYDAFGYVQELFLVAAQLAFGLSCHQNIIYLHCLTELERHQSFEFIKNVYLYNSGRTNVWYSRNYLQRIVDACIKCELTCIMEYTGTVPYKPLNYHLIRTKWDSYNNNWKICLDGQQR